MTGRVPYDVDSPLAWQNYVALQLTQAMLGLVSQSVTEVACRVRPDQVELHFVASDDISEDVEDIRGDLDVFLEGRVEILTEIHQYPARLDRSDRTLIRVYSAIPSEVLGIRPGVVRG